MTKSISLLSALLCTFIWGTTFIAQDTGMDNIGPFTFNAARFFIGFLAIILAAVNIFGGFLVTQRMLAMYKKKPKKEDKE